MRIYYQKLVVIAVFIFFTIPTLFGQNSGDTSKCGCEKPFNEIVLEYFIASGLSEPTIYVLFEKQINEDWYFDFEFRGGDLIDIINNHLLLPPTVQKSILKVIADKRNYLDETEKN
jgi:hypothetical protein